MKKGIAMNDRAILKSQVDLSWYVINYMILIVLIAVLQYRQSTLDNIIVHQARIPEFSTAGLTDFLVELVVTEDKVSRFMQHHQQ
jgi:hypothetical protein